MTRWSLVALSLIGLLCALANAADFHSTAPQLLPTASINALEPFLNAASAAAAAIILFWPRSTRRAWYVLVVVLAATAGFLADLVLVGWFIANPIQLTDDITVVSGGPSTAQILTLGAVGLVLYLVAATLYGFASQAQGVKIGARTGLLVLLLLSIIPVLNILGMIGFLSVTIRRTMSAPPAASA